MEQPQSAAENPFAQGYGLIDGKSTGYTRVEAAQYKRGYLSLGSDPELFVLDADDTVIPAWMFAPAKGKGTLYFWDGVQAEISPLAQKCQNLHLDEVRGRLGQLLSAAKKAYPRSRLSVKTVVEVPQQVLTTALPEHVALGCDPSYNIYGAAGLQVAEPRELKYRFAGGHVHFGGVPHDCAEQVVKMLDAVVGIASVSLFAGMENKIRREFYGLAGEYRLPMHGLEYRVLSNAWLAHPAAAQLTLDLARQAVRFAETTPVARDIMEGATDESVQGIINNLDVEGARKYMTLNKDVYSRFLKGRYGDNHVAKKAAYTLLKGIKSVLDVEAVEANWLLQEGVEWRSNCENKNCTWSSFAQNSL